MRKQRINASQLERMNNLLEAMKLNTVCQEARCPNIGECFSKKVATFMILGKVCTRRCMFCAVRKGKAENIDKDEPKKIAKAVKKLNLNYVVITSVTRDDLKDGGAAHFVKVVKEIRLRNPNVKIELLIPDFKGDMKSLNKVVKCKPDVLNHNLETVRRFYPVFRAKADYKRSLKILENAKKIDSSILTKSGVMLGIGETEKEIFATLNNLRNVRCDIVTIGQYLPPSKSSFPLKREYPERIFRVIARKAEQMGFKKVLSAPLARSSYHASDITNFISKSS